MNYVSWRFAATESVCLPPSGQILPLEASQCLAYDFYRCIGMVDDISAVALKGQHIFNELRYLAWLAEGVRRAVKYEFVGLSVLGGSLAALVSGRYLPPTSIPGRPEAGSSPEPNCQSEEDSQRRGIESIWVSAGPSELIPGMWRSDRRSASGER